MTWEWVVLLSVGMFCFTMTLWGFVFLAAISAANKEEKK